MIAPELYRNVFENNPDGAAILDDLVARFGAVGYVKGGLEADREQTFKLGCHRVVNHILSQINRAHGVEDGEDE